MELSKQGRSARVRPGRMRPAPIWLVASLVGAVGALSTGSPAGAQLDGLGEPGGSLSVVHGAAVTGPLVVSIDGVERKPAVPFAAAQPAAQVPAGRHEVTVVGDHGRATVVVVVGAGCTVSVVAHRPGGARQALALRSFPECPIPAAGPDRASLRLLPASASVGSLTASAGAEQAAAGPGEASSRISLPAGRSNVILRRAGSPAPWRTVAVNAIAGHAYDLLVAGDGDTPVVTSLVDVAAGPPDPFPADTVIPMGGTRGGSAAAARAGLAAGAVLALLLASRRRRLVPLVVVGALLLAAAACEPSERGGAGPAGTSGPIVEERPPVGDRADTRATVVRPAAAGVPVRVTGPGVDAAVVPVANVAIPSLLTGLGGTEVAWLSGTSVPGQRGFAVLAGHVVWGGERAVFGHLRSLRAGQVFEVTTAGGRTTAWEVEGAVVVRKGALPDWLTAPQAVPRLALVTCDGFPAHGSHPDNLVVVARLA